jgi:hypothetical protein
MNPSVLRCARGGGLTLTATALLLACSSSSTRDTQRDAGSDTSPGSSQDASVDSGTSSHDSGARDVTQESSSALCIPNSTFIPLPWAPPTPFSQGVCNAMQIQEYLACFAIDDCGMFFNVPPNQACLHCVETDVSASAYGPVITAGGAIQAVNFGGCQATFDGNTTGSSCGARNNDFNSCIVAECGDCDDILMNGPNFNLCYASAVAGGGPCAPYVETSSCAVELEPDASAGVCNDLGDFIGLWCGGASVDDGGGD